VEDDWDASAYYETMVVPVLSLGGSK